MTLSMAKMISSSKMRLGIHETKQENRHSDNDLFLSQVKNLMNGDFLIFVVV